MRSVHFIGSLVALAVAVPASAACPELEVSADVAERAKAAADSGWTLDPTLAFTAAAANLGAGRAELYRQLGRSDCGAVSLRTPEGATMGLPQPAGSARELISLLAMSPNEAAGSVPYMWDNGFKGLRELALLYAASPGSKRAVQGIVVPKVRDAWANSNLVDGYAYFKQVVGSRYDMALGEDADGSNALIRRMLYEAAFEADRYTGDDIHDYLYAHMNPEG